ncbi:MAG: class I SAM-dependent methyltransferase [bacterium]
MNRPLICLLLLISGFYGYGLQAQETKSADSKPKNFVEKKKSSDDPHKLPDRPGTFMGRAIAPVMSYLGADWLLRDTREEEEHPEQMLDALGLKPGDVVADVGAGVGYTSVRIARRVGPNGKVYASDIQPQMIRMLKANIRNLKMEKLITPVQCTATETGLPDAAIDLVIMVDVYHECSEPIKTLEGIKKALKPGGRLVLIEFRAEDPDVPIRPEHKMTLAQARKEVEAQGFNFLKNDPRLPWQHIIIFQKPTDIKDSKEPQKDGKPS